MNNKIIVLITIVLSGFYANSQVKDMSFTFSPTAEYSWSDNKSGLNDGLLIGGKLGFGFGEFLELRGVYSQSLGLKTNFENFDLPNFDTNLFTSQDVKMTRWGGEFKANIGTRKLMPYFTLGTGVQNMEFDALDYEQIYASLGLGIKLKLTKRAVLSVEAKNTTYNFNAASNLLTGLDKANFNVFDADYSNERLSNWSVLGSLQFYLGGRKPGTLTELDEAYLKKFKGGFRGMQLILEPSVAHISFDDKSLFNDTYLLGGYAGLDFNEYIGLRAFYFKASKEDEISTNFDELSMYGAEFRARLNDGNGVTPYLILGGGYLKASDLYLGKNAVNVKSSEFASGGLGLNIPLGRRVLISGGLRAMITSGEDVTNISAPNQIQTHLMYNAGIKFSIGRKSKAPSEVYNQKLNDELTVQSQTNDEKIQQLKNEYKSKLNQLENDIAKAYNEKDVSKALLLIEEKKDTQAALKEVEKVSLIQKENNATKNEKPTNTIIQMTPAEFELLIDRILKSVNEPTSSVQTKDKLIEDPKKKIIEIKDQQLDSIHQRMNALEKLILSIQAQPVDKKEAVQEDVEVVKDQKKSKKEETIVNEEMVKSEKKEKVAEKENETAKKMEKRLEELNNKIDENSSAIKNQTNKKEVVKVQKDTTTLKELNDSISTIDSVSITLNEGIDKEQFLIYQNSSIEAGYQFSNAGFATFGAKAYFSMGESSVQMIPEVFVGFANSTIYGVTANLVVPFLQSNEKIQPYIGAGVGALYNGNNIKGLYNAILGATLPVISENMFVNYTMRNTFDYNQISIGYKLPF